MVTGIRASIGMACTTAASGMPVALATFAGENFGDSFNADTTNWRCAGVAHSGFAAACSEKEVINTALMPIVTALCEWAIILLTPEIVDNSV
tara:strand:+ start:1203 stop:1478 length:276 start_codon:yes stop_codon:yes gene_type:complete